MPSAALNSQIPSTPPLRAVAHVQPKKSLQDVEEIGFMRNATLPLVLVVDDEPIICETLSRVLEDEGCQTLVAHSGVEALEKAEAFKPNLVFLDIWMPGWDGIETLEKIKALLPELPVIMISGHATIANALEATKRGAADFIEKPLSIESVILSAKRALQQFGDQLASDKADLSSETPLVHAGAFSRVMPGNNVGQRTLKKSAILYGQALHSGQKSGLVLEPLPPNSGIHFAKIGDSKTIPAFVDFVESTAFATTIRSGQHSVATVEHLLAALHAYRITNLLIKCNAEVPVLDGSSLEFCRVIEESGIEEQGGEWLELAVDREFVFEPKPGSPERIVISPADHLEVRYDLHYPAPVGAQSYTFHYRGVESFKSEIAPSRTFGFMKDIGRLQKAGLAAGGRLDNFILIGDDRIVNTELRFPDELARHKVLDAIGDLFLVGRPLRAKIHATMTGHSDNVNALRLIGEVIKQNR